MQPQFCHPRGRRNDSRPARSALWNRDRLRHVRLERWPTFNFSATRPAQFGRFFRCHRPSMRPTCGGFAGRVLTVPVPAGCGWSRLWRSYVWRAMLVGEEMAKWAAEARAEWPATASSASPACTALPSLRVEPLRFDAAGQPRGEAATVFRGREIKCPGALLSCSSPCLPSLLQSLELERSAACACDYTILDSAVFCKSALRDDQERPVCP